MSSYLRNMKIHKIDLVSAGANQKADIVLYKSRNKGGNTMGPEDIKTMLDEALQPFSARLDEIEKSLDTSTEGEGTTEDEDEGEGTTDVNKATDEVIKALQQSVEQANLRATASETVVKEMKVAQETAVLKSKLQGYSNLSIDVDKIAETMKSLKPEAQEELFKTFEAANEASKGVFNTEGVTGGAETRGSNLSVVKGIGDTATWAQIEQAAMARVEKSGEKLSKAQAINKFLATEEGQTLYNQYMKGGVV